MVANNVFHDVIFPWVWQIHAHLRGDRTTLRVKCPCGYVHYWRAYPDGSPQYELASQVSCPHDYQFLDGGEPATVKELYEQLWLWIYDLDQHWNQEVDDLSQALSLLNDWAYKLLGMEILQTATPRFSCYYARATLPLMLWMSQRAIKQLDGQPVMVLGTDPILIAYDVRKITGWQYCIIPWPMSRKQIKRGLTWRVVLDEADLPRKVTPANRRLAAVLARTILGMQPSELNEAITQ